MFLCVNAVVIQQLRSSQFKTYTVKLPWQTHVVIFFKKESKGDFKIVMHIYADEFLSLTCFPYV